MVRSAGTDIEMLGQWLVERFEGLDGRPGFWWVDWEDVCLYFQADEGDDRFRIQASVVSIDPGDSAALWTLLLANYAKTIDVRYAVNDGTLWVVFVHRLSWLSQRALDSGIKQLQLLLKNTGTTYCAK